MIRVVFKNLEKSELARDLATERISAAIERFPDLARSRITVTLGMENSPLQAGPDLFTTKLVVQGGRFDRLTLEKSAPSLYTALAEVSQHLLERINRAGDKARVRERVGARRVVKHRLLAS